MACRCSSRLPRRKFAARASQRTRTAPTNRQSGGRARFSVSSHRRFLARLPPYACRRRQIPRTAPPRGLRHGGRLRGPLRQQMGSPRATGRPSRTRDPERLTVTLPIAWQILYWTWVASEVVIGIATRTRQSTGRVHDRGSLLLLWVVVFSSMTAAIWISEVTPPNLFGGSRSLKLAGVVVLVIALAIRWTAIYTL